MNRQTMSLGEEREKAKEKDGTGQQITKFAKKNKQSRKHSPQSRTGGQERNSEKTLTFCFGYRRTDGPTDTASSRVACPRLKKVYFDDKDAIS